MLRISTPIRFFFRYATEDIELHGEKIREGDPVMLLYPAANRDETVWGESANEFDVARRLVKEGIHAQASRSATGGAP